MYIKRFVKHYYIMLIPALLWLFFFSIVPMFGIVMAFQDYNPGQGILHSKFVGLANFEYMFQMSDITQVLRNTVVIAVGKIIGNIIIPLVFALLLNELAVKKLKRPIQTIVYLPYFLSWVILAKIVLNIFGYTGPVNQIIGLFGGDAVNFFGEAKLFQPLVIGTDIWKGFGYNTVVYLAAILVRSCGSRRLRTIQKNLACNFTGYQNNSSTSGYPVSWKCPECRIRPDL